MNFSDIFTEIEPYLQQARFQDAALILQTISEDAQIPKIIKAECCYWIGNCLTSCSAQVFRSSKEESRLLLRRATQAYADALFWDTELLKARFALIKGILGDIERPALDAVGLIVPVDDSADTAKDFDLTFELHSVLALYGTVCGLCGSFDKSEIFYSKAFSYKMSKLIREPDLSSFDYYLIRNIGIEEQTRQTILTLLARFVNRNVYALEVLKAIPSL
jgi:hypothetical protein